MLNNMNVYGGVVFSQRVLLSLVENGMRRDEAYRLVQKHAHDAWNTQYGDFQASLKTDKAINNPYQRRVNGPNLNNSGPGEEKVAINASM